MTNLVLFKGGVDKPILNLLYSRQTGEPGRGSREGALPAAKY